MAKPSAHAKRTDQMYMSLPEFKELDCLKEVHALVKLWGGAILDDFESYAGPKALKRLKNQAKRDGISPLEKLCRLYRLSRKK